MITQFFVNIQNSLSLLLNIRLYKQFLILYLISHKKYCITLEWILSNWLTLIANFNSYKFKLYNIGNFPNYYDFYGTTNIYLIGNKILLGFFQRIKGLKFYLSKSTMISEKIKLFSDLELFLVSLLNEKCFLKVESTSTPIIVKL